MEQTLICGVLMVIVYSVFPDTLAVIMSGLFHRKVGIGSLGIMVILLGDTTLMAGLIKALLPIRSFIYLRLCIRVERLILTHLARFGLMGLKVLTEVAVNRVLVIGGFSLNKFHSEQCLLDARRPNVRWLNF